MNERIRKLIEQAHEQKPVIVMDSVTCESTHKIGNGGVPMYRSELNPEKFADLILFECIKLAVFKGDTATAQAIKEHFEVKL